MNQFFHIFATTWHCCYFLIFAILVGIEDILLAFEHRGFLGSSNGKQSACNAGDLGLVSGLGRSPGEGHGNLLQYSCLGNPMHRGAWRTIVHGITKESDMVEWLTTTTNMVGLRCCVSFRVLSLMGALPGYSDRVQVIVCVGSERVNSHLENVSESNPRLT